MATENPMPIIPGGGRRGPGLASLRDNITASDSGQLSSSGSHEGVVQELDLLLRRHPRHDTTLGRRDTLSYRSGSAPPSVAGSLAAIGSIFGDNTSNIEGAPSYNDEGSGDGTENFNSEHELLSDPAYLAYYYAHRHLNPRLPPPLISRSNYRFAHRLGGAGDSRKLWSLDDSNNRSLFSSQLLPTHKEEPEFLEEEKSPIANLIHRASEDFRESGIETWMGFRARPKSLVDLIQEDFPRTPSPVYNLSRCSSRAANENGADAPSMSDIHITHLQDASLSAVTMADLSTIISNSRSATPNPCSVHNLGGGSNGSHSSGSTSSLRTPSPSPLAGYSINASIVDDIARLNGSSTLTSSEARNVSASSGTSSLRTAELAAAFEGLSFNDVQEVPVIEEDDKLPLRHLQHDSLDQHGSLDINNRQYQRQRAQATQSHMHMAYSQVSTQSLQQQQFLGPDQGFRGNTKYGIPNLSQDLNSQVDAGSSIYASAAMSYMNAGNPYYQNIQSAPLFSPQYGISGYPMNPAIMPAMMAAFTAPGAIASYEGAAAAAAAAAAVAAGMGARVSPSSTLGGFGVDMQNLYKYTGQGSTTLQSHFQDPLYLNYLQQYLGEDACTAAALNDAALRGYVASGHVDPLELQKNQLNPMFGYSAEQRSHFSRSTSLGVPIASKSESVSPAYYGSPPGIGFVMPYPNSPISSSMLPGSPIVPGALSVRQADRNYRLSGASWPSSGGTFSGWLSQRDDTTDDIKCSSLLEELKNSKTRRLELSDIVGHVIEFSMDQHGSRFIQQKLETATSEEKDLVFQEVLPQALRLMTDVFGNYVIQKFFEHGSHEQRMELANRLVGQVLNLSLQMYGCRVIQKALEVVDLEQQVKLVAELDGYVMRCVRDQNGNHVIQKCIECVPPDKINFIISAFYGQVVTLSTHPYGCRVIQRVLEHCTEKQKQNGVMDEILSATCTLAQDQYGNYVVQHVLEHGNQEEKSEIIKKLAGKFVQMSQHKFASNVVEKCLEFGGPAERQILVNEMLGDSDENEPLQAMMKDQFANYVVQKVLETCDNEQRELLLSRIKVHVHALKKYTYGKHIVARVEKLISAGERHGAQIAS